MWPAGRSIEEVFGERRAPYCSLFWLPLATPLPPMNPTDFSVLLLAWDDADPAVVVLGGSALPPTLPLVYQLATWHPVLAVYPHLPTIAEAAATAPASAAATPALAWPEPGVIPNPLDAEANGPGVRLLPPTETTGQAVPMAAGGSRLVGLDDLLPVIQGALPTSHSLSLALEVAPDVRKPRAATPPASARNQWPTRFVLPLSATAGQVPAAPYAGAAEPAPVVARAPSHPTTRESFPSPPPAPAHPATTTLLPMAAGTAAEAPVAPATAAATPVTPAAFGAISVSPLSSDTTALAPFDEPVEEMGAAEARDLDAPDDDLVPDAAPPAPIAPPETKAAAPAAPALAAPGWAVRQPTLDGLNFRMIQYARRAAQLVAGRTDFGVIYAPGWPAWLAALEIRNRSGRPLVLYVPALASDMAPTGERGWLLGVERMALRRATLVLVPDAEVLRQLRARHADALGEVRIVPAADEVAMQLVLAEVALG